ncbi:MAG TPA: hypothetical protein VKV73_09685 [Chloroflexota bacterium]|nr:hypothetical protein [Chloroflexota bacterium]
MASISEVATVDSPVARSRGPGRLTIGRRFATGLAFFALVGAGLVAAVVDDAPLTWDGAYYLFKALDLQTPFVSTNRLINAALQAPVVVASYFTSDLGVLRRVFDAAYVLVPLVSLASAWWLCRGRPGLFKWPALGICVASLPGRMFFVGESTMATDLFWPLLLGLLLVDFHAGDLLLLALLAAGLWASHPIAVALFGLAGLIAAVRAWRSDRRWWAVGLVCLLLAVTRALLPLSGYELESATAARLGDAFSNSVAGKPLLALACTAGVVIVWLLRPLLVRESSRRLGLLYDMAAAGLILLAGVILTVWASHPEQWEAALDFRFWQAPVSLALMLPAIADALRRRSTLGRWEPAVLACGIAFCLVVGVQAWTWTTVTRRFETSLAAQAAPCSTLTTLDDTRGASPLNHWASAVYAVLLQSRRPTMFVLADDASCQQLLATGSLAIAAWDVRSPNGGWFQLMLP